jgi:hypothetical protein
MTIVEKSHLKRALFEAVGSHVRAHGFEARLTKDRFVRLRDGRTDIYQLVCLDGKPGWRIQPNVGVRIERVEEIFHQTSEFEPKYQGDTPTIGGSVGAITAGNSRACEFLLESQSDVELVAGNISKLFDDFAIPYFEKFSSLAAIDAELNDRPTDRTPNRGATWLRCSTGVIVAKLVGRPNYDDLVETYREVLRNSDKGFYLKFFDPLVESLKSVRSEA